MAGPNRPARLNHTLLAILGFVLLVAGACVALLGAGVAARLLPAVPVVSTLDRSAPLLAGPPTPPTWAAYVAIAGCVVLGLLCLRWLLAQTRRTPRTGTWTLPATGGDSGGRTRIASDHVADAVVADITAYAGVRKASAYLTGERERPMLHLDVTAGPDASPTGLRRQIHEHALPRLRQALDLDGLTARMVLRLDAGSPSRTR